MSGIDSLPQAAGECCWKVERADRAAVLIDAASYFRAVRRAILQAQRSVCIIGWDLHSATRLVRDDERDAGDDAPGTLREVLERAVRDNPRLNIHILLWDWAVLYAGERELMPRINLDWRLPPSVHMELDGAVPIGASQHQKLVVIDDVLAFCGGLDLTVRRWDRRDHAVEEPERVDHEGAPYGPYHDAQVAVSGPAAGRLAEEARRRWQAATGESLPQAEPSADGATLPDLPEAAVVLQDVRAAIARTVPDTDAERAVTEVRDSLLAMIANASETIYIENQFVCADVIAHALAERLQQVPQLEVLIVTPGDHKGWLESRSMGAGRVRFVQQLQEAGVADRAPLMTPVRRGDDGDTAIFVHAKVMIVDGCVLRIGSANLNNRSMGFDSECDVIVLAENDAQRAAVAGVLHELLGEHLGAAPQRVAAAIAEHGLLGAVAALNDGERGLRPIEENPDEATVGNDLYVTVADPERPVCLRDFLPFVGDQGDSEGVARRSIIPLIAIALVCGALALVWRVTPISELAEPGRLQTLLAGIQASPWTPLLMLGGYVAGTFLMLPVTAMVIATGLAFDALTAFVYAITGSLAGAIATYLVGRYFDAGFLERRAGTRLRPIANAVRRRGILAMATVRVIPVAPFPIVNAIAGAARVRFRDFVIGTVLGMAPGIAVITALGDSMGALLEGWTWTDALQVAALVAVWIGLAFGARRLLRVDTERDND